jgi:hypothetical protein
VVLSSLRLSNADFNCECLLNKVLQGNNYSNVYIFITILINGFRSSTYPTWLLQNDPKFLDRMNRQSGARYDTLTNKGEDLQFEDAETRQSFRQQLLSHTMYQNDIRAREMIEYSSMELNLNQFTNQETGFNPKEARPDSQQLRHSGREHL